MVWDLLRTRCRHVCRLPKRRARGASFAHLPNRVIVELLQKSRHVVDLAHLHLAVVKLSCVFALVYGIIMYFFLREPVRQPRPIGVRSNSCLGTGKEHATRCYSYADDSLHGFVSQHVRQLVNGLLKPFERARLLTC